MIERRCCELKGGEQRMEHFLPDDLFGSPRTSVGTPARGLDPPWPKVTEGVSLRS